VADQVEGNDEESVGEGNGGFLFSGPMGNTVEKGRQETRFANGGPGTLREHSAQVGIAFVGAAGMPLARAFGVAGAESRPTSQVVGGGEAAHIGADFGDERPGGDFLDARHLTEPVDDLLVRLPALADLEFPFAELLFQPVQLVQQLAEQVPEVIGGAATERFAQLLLFRLQSFVPGENDERLGAYESGSR
jgi:hypothetical protein